MNKTINYIIQNYLYNTKGSIEVQRLKESWFLKYLPEYNWHDYSDILGSKEKLFDLLVVNGYDVPDNVHTHDTNICVQCDNETTFKTLKWGYRKYCSQRCATLDTLNIEKRKETMMKRYGVDNAVYLESTQRALYTPEIKEKRINSIRKTMLARYGIECALSKGQFQDKIIETRLARSPEQKQAIKDKIRETAEANGNWITEDQVENFKDYSRLVWRYTNANDLTVLENIENRGMAPDEYHLDHRYSIFQGFKDDVPAKIIGSIDNLEMLQSGQNLSKNKKCSITLDELLQK